MPAYSFMGQFVPYVEDGSKPHTVRNRRKNPAKVGDTLYLYYAMRTRQCRKLKEVVCTNTHSISFTKNAEIVFYSRLLTLPELQLAIERPLFPMLPIEKVLSPIERDSFAWLDGFRPNGTTQNSPSGSYVMMLGFWKSTHQLPWAGDVIYWKRKNEVYVPVDFG